MSPAYQEMVESFDRLAYMVRTTSPHLQRLLDEFKTSIQAVMPMGVD